MKHVIIIKPPHTLECSYLRYLSSILPSFPQSVMPAAPAGRRRFKGACSGLGVNSTEERTPRIAKVMNSLGHNSPKTLPAYMGPRITFSTANSTAARTPFSSLGAQMSSGDEDENSGNTHGYTYALDYYSILHSPFTNKHTSFA